MNTLCSAVPRRLIVDPILFGRTSENTTYTSPPLKQLRTTLSSHFVRTQFPGPLVQKKHVLRCSASFHPKQPGIEKRVDTPPVWHHLARIPALGRVKRAPVACLDLSSGNVVRSSHGMPIARARVCELRRGRPERGDDSNAGMVCILKMGSVNWI